VASLAIVQRKPPRESGMAQQLFLPQRSNEGRGAASAPITQDISMQPDIFAFLHKNIFLVAVCVASGAMLLWPLLQRFAGAGGKEVSVPQAVQLINRRDAVVLDVRDASDFASGHIPNARHVPAADVGKRLKELEKLKQRPVIVSCRSGTRAAAACGVLRKNGFQEVFALKGGVLGWQQASMPLEK